MATAGAAAPLTLVERLCLSVARVIEVIRCRTRCADCCESDCNTVDTLSHGPGCGSLTSVATVASDGSGGTVTTSAARQVTHV